MLGEPIIDVSIQGMPSLDGATPCKQRLNKVHFFQLDTF